MIERRGTPAQRTAKEWLAVPPGRDVTCLLARAYRDAGRHEAAFVVYGQLLGDDPLDEGVAEGLLMAAAGMKDAAQLEEPWQHVLVCADGEVSPELRGVGERLRREAAGWNEARGQPAN